VLAAIYARKSTEQNGVNEEEKSVTRQIAHATAYAAEKGWTVAEAHIYVDDGISGAEFEKRPGLMRLLNALKPKPPFQALIMSEESRLGREAIETAYALKQFITAGVQVWFYLEKRQRALESPMDKLLLSLTAFADEQEREKARQRTYDAMSRKAQAAQVTGGRVFGYDNVEVSAEALGKDGQKKRAYVVRQINETEAPVVRRIFELCVAGKGLTTIAKSLNAVGLPCPRPNPGRPKGWAPSSVREILHRPLYRGEIVWNQTKKRDQWGRHQQRPRPESEWLRVPAPELRIVSEELWKAAHDRLEATRVIYLRHSGGQLWGRPASGIESKYLLTGMAVCGCCGGSLVVRTRQHGQKRVPFYACGTNHRRGSAVCANAAIVPAQSANEAVLGTLEADVLAPEVIAEAMARAVDQLQATDGSGEAEREQVAAELEKVERELRNLATAIAAGGGLPPLLKEMKARQESQKNLSARLAGLVKMNVAPALGESAVQEEVARRLEEWRGVLRRQVPQARQILRKLIDGRLRFTPKLLDDSGIYEFEGTAVLGNLLAGIAFPQGLVSPAGIFLDIYPGRASGRLG